ncbi:MAG: pyrroline-5-carboxylate reductase [Oscillospiraceae bacterium]|nr:pyrroline-5-carboxylate reductase [Oscillospiraceae bacterium]
MNTNIKLGFLGAGNMGSAMMRGIAASALRKSGEISEIAAFDTDAAKLAALSDAGVIAAESSQSLADSADYLVLAVKPQVLGEVLDGISIRSEQVIISICAGISAEFIRSHTIADARVILVMPNTPLMLGMGATALAKCEGITDAEFQLAKEMFATCGIAEEIPENRMREVIAVNSSSPAFLYLFAKGFLEFAASVNMDEGAALRLFAQAMIGSAHMLTDSGKSVDELIRMVSSPGGTTLAGLDGLYEGRLTETVRDCCERCTNRAYELAGAKRG